MPYLIEGGDEWPVDYIPAPPDPGVAPAPSPADMFPPEWTPAQVPDLPAPDSGATATVAQRRSLLDAFVSQNSATEELSPHELPAKAWGDFRDTLVYDLPFVGSHVRTRARELADVVASDLWHRST